MEQVPAQLVDLQACQKCLHAVGSLVCASRNGILIHPVRNVLPIMLIEEAVRADDTIA